MGVEGPEKGVGATETYSAYSDNPIIQEGPDPDRPEKPRIGGSGEFPNGWAFNSGRGVPNHWAVGGAGVPGELGFE